MKIVLSIILLLLSLVTEAQLDEYLIDSARVGPFYPGMTTEKALLFGNRYPSVVLDTVTVKREDFEFTFLDILIVDEKDTLLSLSPSTMETDKINNIWVHNSRFKTNRGIGIGGTLGEIRNQYPQSTFYIKDDMLSLTILDLGLNLKLDHPYFRHLWINSKPDTNDIPNTAKVRLLWIETASNNR
jgi:hypothetical protein